MRIALIGYGKMGKAIEKVAQERGHVISHQIDGLDKLATLNPEVTDLAIEFTQPEAAYKNIETCLKNNVPVISGTTGWLDSYPQLVEQAEKHQGTFLHASNFSIGVNLFFELNEWLAQKMKNLPFHPSMEEIHHTEKKDSPSGTAIKLAEGIIQNSPITDWINEESTDHKAIGIVSKRIPNVPGTHTVSYESKLESIQIHHVAHDRSVFAEGVVLVAEWIQDKTGVFTMSDFLNQQ
ncbi:MAG: 4-hydroxy-tetrahydrodipicolinate reductase [Bacteroidota bacterium]